MNLIYSLAEIHARNNGRDIPMPSGSIAGYSKGFALMLSDGAHDGFCFPGYATKAEAIESVKASKIPDGWHLYLLSANGFTSNLQARWCLRCEIIL